MCDQGRGVQSGSAQVDRSVPFFGGLSSGDFVDYANAPEEYQERKEAELATARGLDGFPLADNVLPSTKCWGAQSARRLRHERFEQIKLERFQDQAQARAEALTTPTCAYDHWQWV